jgi:hypothetical protein
MLYVFVNVPLLATRATCESVEPCYGGEIFVFNERGCRFLARLSHERQNASLLCLFCWRLFL